MAPFVESALALIFLTLAFGGKGLAIGLGVGLAYWLLLLFIGRG